MPKITNRGSRAIQELDLLMAKTDEVFRMGNDLDTYEEVKRTPGAVGRIAGGFKSLMSARQEFSIAKSAIYDWLLGNNAGGDKEVEAQTEKESSIGQVIAGWKARQDALKREGFDALTNNTPPDFVTAQTKLNEINEIDKDAEAALETLQQFVRWQAAWNSLYDGIKAWKAKTYTSNGKRKEVASEKAAIADVEASDARIKSLAPALVAAIDKGIRTIEGVRNMVDRDHPSTDYYGSSIGDALRGAMGRAPGIADDLTAEIKRNRAMNAEASSEWPRKKEASGGRPTLPSGRYADVDPGRLLGED